MDYCSSCRRHLNGALVCPGCGAYAPDIDPSAAGGRSGPVAAGAWRAENAWDDRSVWDETRAGTRELPLAYTGASAGSQGPDTDPPGGHEAADTAAPATAAYEAPQQGRAARRRQLARWKKNQRRAVVATAVALVGGGLTVSVLNGDSTHGVRAATAPEDTTMGGAAGEAPTYTEPTSSRQDTPRSSPTPTTPPHADRASHREPPRGPAPRTTPSDPRTDAAATPRELPRTTPPRSTVPSTVDTATGTDGRSTSKGTERTTPPAADEGAEARQPASPATPPPATSPAQSATSPSDSKELCLLVICLG
ncbi:SCO2400 family protein [Streptomyces venetus]|uniref:SCO2400 family protein n=1 Tax=Streptomyces venetus TaxID=1701086 RepID=UPI003C2F5AF7